MPSPARHAALIAVLGGCVSAFAAPNARPTAPATYDVAVVALTAERAVTTTFSLAVQKAKKGAITATTTRTEGTIQQGPDEIQFDTARPSAEDPWPLVLQHAVASAPITVRLDDRGSIDGIIDARTWALTAKLQLGEVALPPEALTGADALIDPVGVVADLRRTFPGWPAQAHAIERPERVGNLAATVTETCSEPRKDGRFWTVRCEGTAVAAAGQEALLHDTTTWLELRVDRRGLVEAEQQLAGTVVRLRAQDGLVVEAPLATQRLVRRR